MDNLVCVIATLYIILVFYCIPSMAACLFIIKLDGSIVVSLVSLLKCYTLLCSCVAVGRRAVQTVMMWQCLGKYSLVGTSFVSSVGVRVIKAVAIVD